MKITGIIAEYNPFHNGHAYQLQRAKEETDADYLIIVMSGNFVQRGAPALLDKYVRTEMALLGGADLVLELPVLWSTASAEYFAGAGIALLEQLGCVNALCFGCETMDSSLFTAICRMICDETAEYRDMLKGFLKEGIPYAGAREKTVQRLLPGVDAAQVASVLGNPNNILALEYQKAIEKSRSAIQIYPILRKGEGHHSQNVAGAMEPSMASASAIRAVLADDPVLENTGYLAEHIRQVLAQNMPFYACQLLTDYRSRYPFLYEDDCSQMLHYCLLQNAACGYAQYADCTPDFSNRMLRHLEGYTNFSQYCACLKSKDMAHARIRRILLHILLDIRQNDYRFWRSRFYMPYARILGFRRESRELLSCMKKHSAIPLFTRAADAEHSLDGYEYSFLQKSLFADAVYGGILAGKSTCPVQNECRRQLVII